MSTRNLVSGSIAIDAIGGLLPKSKASSESIKKMNLQNDEDFTMEDNVLKGRVATDNLVSMNIGEVLLDAFDKNPDHVSQIDAVTEEKTTHVEMKERSIRCALWMEKEGLGCDDVVSLFTHVHLDTYIPIFATYFTQAVLHLWKCDIKSYSIEKAKEWLELFAPKLIFACPYAVDVIEKALAEAKLSAKIVVIGEHPRYQSLNDILWSQSSSEVENYRPPKRKSPQEIAVILMSSGSTGFPKGVMISAETLLTNVVDYKYRVDNKNVYCRYGSPIGIANTDMMIICILQNATRIISRRPDSRELCRVIEKYKVYYAHVTPIMLDSLVRFEGINQYDLECLKVMRTGGAKLNRVTFDKLRSSCLRDKVYQGYGTTEIGSGRVLPKLGRRQTSHNSIGFIASNIQLKIIDRATGKVLGTNELGEILIKTPTKMLGYYKNPKLTRKAIDDEGWYHTGDLGYYDENGEIFFMGRITDAFEHCGQEIFIHEIEDILWKHPAVGNLTVLPVSLRTVELVAFVVVRPGENITENNLIELLKMSEKLKTLPISVQFIDGMPLTALGKVSKFELKELAANSELGTGIVRDVTVKDVN